MLNMQIGVILLWIFFAYSWDPHCCSSEGMSCIQVMQPKFQCDAFNISPEAVRLVPRQPTQYDLLMLQIDRQSMLYPDGEITRMLSRITWSAIYPVYNEKVLRLPADSHLKEIRLANAPRLRSVMVSGTNNALKVLLVFKSVMKRISTSIRHLQRLEDFTLSEGLLESFSLEPLEGIRNLTIINLSINKLRRLEASKNPSLIMPAKQLDLSSNLLEYIDMEFFAPFKHLNHLQLSINRLKQIIANGPVLLPSLSILGLEDNEFTLLNFSNWIAPKLGSLILRGNRLTQLPFGIDRFTVLEQLYLSDNYLTTLDLQQLESLQFLRTLHVTDNQLHAVLPNCQSRHSTASCQRVSLPALDEINMYQNNLTSIDFSSWDMPALRTIILTYNGLKRILNINNKFPLLEYLHIKHNDIYCVVINGTATPKKGAFNVQETTDNTTCPTNSSFPHPYEQGVVCCNQ